MAGPSLGIEVDAGEIVAQTTAADGTSKSLT